MKFYKFFKCLFLIIVVGTTLLLELAPKYLLQQNIEFTDKLVIFKIIMTWFITPFVLIMYYHNTMISKLRDNSGMIAAVSLSNGIVLFVLVCCFIVRIGVFVLFQDRIETPLSNGQVVVEHGNFGPQEILYYQSINQFLYKRIE
ncbi:MAG: hypothetical protein HDR04_03305 [Lachnospiraceae bacterium]|nr:hypothetical protein [Lachnospiraceae bacterium]